LPSTIRRDKAACTLTGDSHVPPPKVSVVVRSVGRPTLAAALASIASQGYPSGEVVVVAATGDRHPSIVQRCGPYPIRTVRPRDRLARAAAAAAGVRAASGDWITFLDDDDEMLPGHIEGLVSSAAAMPGARAVSGRAMARFRDGRTQIWGQRFALVELYQRNFVHLSTLLFHRSLVDAGIAFDLSLEMHEDWDFALQIAQLTRFADWPRPTFQWHADAGTSGAGGGANANDEAFARYRDYVYAKWSAQRHALAERCLNRLQHSAHAAASGRLVEAAAAAREVLGFSQNDPDALNMLAMVATRQGDRKAALRHQLTAVEVRPDDPDLRYNLALVRLAGADSGGARAALEDALKLNPSHTRAALKLRELDARLKPPVALRDPSDGRSPR
jgi:glycosyltransferase involved in cell wall biosynthesis